MVDEELLRPSREHFAHLDALIRKAEEETIEAVEKWGKGDEDYVRRKWREFYEAVEPLRREKDAVTKVIADYYALQTDQPPLIVPAGQGALK